MTSITRGNETPKVRLINPWFALFIGLAAGTFAAPFIKLTQQGGLPSPIIASARMVLAAIVLTPFVLRRFRSELGNLTRRDLIMAMFAGILLQTHFLMLVFALANTSTLIVLVITNTSPLWVALLERVWLKERLNHYVWSGMFITIFGSIFIALNSNTVTTGSGDSSPISGAIFALFAALAGASYLTLGRSVRNKISLFPYVWIVFGFGGIIGLSVAVLSGVPIAGHPAEGYFWLIMLTLIPQLIGHTGINFALGYLKATLISLATQSLIITASLIAFFLFAEVPTMADIIGSIVIAFGVLIAILYRNHSRSKIES